MRLAVTRPLTKVQLKEIVARVESRLDIAPFIIDGKAHTEHCRCAQCWLAFQAAWVAKPWAGEDGNE